MSELKEIFSILEKGINKENQLKCIPLLNKQRLLIEKDKKRYWDEIKKLIFADSKIKYFVGINFARYYLDEENVPERLEQIIDDDSNTQNIIDIQIKIQAIYEYLTELPASIKKKEKWFDFLLSHKTEYKETLFDVVYGNVVSYEMKYETIKNKYNKTQSNKEKLWLYILELYLCEINKDNVRDILLHHINDEDKFIGEVASKILMRIDKN
jgi:hypothetical protein